MTTAAFVFSAVAVVGAVVSAFYAGRLYRAAEKANALPALIDFVREYRDYEPDRRYILLDLREHETTLGISSLPDEPRKHVVQVCHYLDQLGFLVDQGAVKSEALAGLMGESILTSWGALAPYIRSERASRNAAYAGYFEDLAARVLAIDPPTVRTHLRRVPADAPLPQPFVPENYRPKRFIWRRLLIALRRRASSRR